VLDETTEFQVIAQASDGLEGIQKAKELQPDLILLDLNLPKVDGFQAARQLRNLAPLAKLLFLSQEFSSDIVDAAFRLGARGYIYKLRAHSDLLPAIKAVFRGQRFVSTGIKCRDGADFPPRVTPRQR
jgi:DNA-binding NarL/FixJ family response regulator